MKKLKITKNETDSKPIHFHFATDKRHLNLNQWMKETFTISPTTAPVINQVKNNKNQHGNTNKD